MDFVEAFPTRAPFSCLGRAAVQAWEEGRATAGLCAATVRAQGWVRARGATVGEGVMEPTVPAHRVPLWAWGRGAGPGHVPALCLGTSSSQLGFAALLFMCCVQTWPRWTCPWPVLCRACARAPSLPAMPWCVGLRVRSEAVLWGQEVWVGRSTVRGRHTLCSLGQLKQPLCSFPGPLLGLEHMWPRGGFCDMDSARLGAGGWSLSSSTSVAAPKPGRGVLVGYREAA